MEMKAEGGRAYRKENELRTEGDEELEQGRQSLKKMGNQGTMFMRKVWNWVNGPS